MPPVPTGGIFIGEGNAIREAIEAPLIAPSCEGRLFHLEVVSPSRTAAVRVSTAVSNPS